MLTEENARSALLAEMPDVVIEKVVRYRELFLIRALHDEPGETQMDPFFSVDVVTGEVKDFSVMHDGDILEIAAAFTGDTSNLAHYGKKGMKWGVRNDDDGTPSVTAATPKSLSRPKAEIEAEVAERETAFFEKGGISISRKQALIGVGVLLAAGGTYYAVKNANSAPKEGDPITAEQFTELRHASQTRTILGSKTGYLTEQSYRQGEFTLPAGHVFSRLSGSTETGFRDKTYALHSEADYNRYLSEFSRTGVGQLNRITFASNRPIRVPSLTQRLDVLRGTMEAATNRKPSSDEVVREYESLMKTYWTEPRAATFFNDLRSRGFDALVDDADAGQAGESPLLLIDSSAFGAKTTTPITSQDVDNARNNLTEFKDRK